MEIRIPAKIECLGTALKDIARCAADVGLEERRIQEITLAAEEALANICLHAYAEDGGGEVGVTCSKGLHGELVVELVDSGRPFNPLNAQPPDLSGELERLKEGGAGIPLIRAMADRVDYRRREGKNILELIIQPSGQGL